MGTVDDWLLTQLRSKFFSYELTSVYLYLVSLKRCTGFMKMVNTFIKTVDLNYFKYSLMGFTKTNVHRSSNSNFKKKSNNFNNFAYDAICQTVYFFNQKINALQNLK